MATPVSNSVTPPLPSSNGTLTDEFIYGLVEGSSWQFGAGPRVLTYSFSLPDGVIFTGSGGGWLPSLEFAFENALTAWSNVANLSFAESGSGTNFQTSGANIAVTLTGYQLQSFGAVALGILPDPPLGDDLLFALGLSRAQYPNPEGDLFFDDFYGAFSFLNPGGMGLTIMMHEIGHALGLNHPIDGVGPDARPSDFNSLGIAQYDAARYTIMTAEIAMGGSDAFGNAATPMPLDILAIQQIYGPNTSYHTGNDVYSPVSGAMTTIWDAGGIDTIDASGYYGVTVDLRPGAIMDFLSSSVTVLAVAYDDFLPGSALIENAIGGFGGNTLYGNNAANLLNGGSGGDRMFGGAGNDIYVVSEAGDTAVEYTVLERVRASIAADGTQGDADSLRMAMSGDGSKVLFASDASTLVAGDTAGTTDLFLKDLQIGVLTRVNTDAGGARINLADPHYAFDMTADARYVVFSTFANLLPADGGVSAVDVYRKDLQTGALTLVSRDAVGGAVPHNVEEVGDIQISADGNVVSFAMTNVVQRVWVKNLQTGTLVQATTDSGGNQALGWSFDYVLSANGRYVAFSTLASNLDASDTNGVSDVYLKDLQTGATTRVSGNSFGGQGASISADGRYVTFQANDSLHRKDLQSGVFDVAVSSVPGAAPTNARLSDDGHYLSFTMYDSSLVQGDSNFQIDAFVKDLQTGQVARASTGVGGAQPNGGGVQFLSMSADGAYIGVGTTASNLVAGDTNGFYDVYAFANPLSVPSWGAGDTGGTDTVQSAISYVLGVNLENLTLTGAGSISGTGNGQANVLTGNSGNNTVAGGVGNDTLNGGGGIDTADYSASLGKVHVNLGAGLAQDGLGGQDILAAIENAIGTAADDFLAGNAGANRLEGGAGDDLIYGFDPTGPGTDTGSIAATRVATGLAQPVFVGAPAGDTARLFIVEKLGNIKILNLATNAVLPTPFLSLGGQISTDGEGGVLGLAFHPDFAQNGLFYVNVINTSGDTEIRRYQVSSTDPNRAEAGSGTVVLTIDQPGFTNHKAGWLGFGPDGYLYASLGDGGSGGDPLNSGQNPDSLLGKMLRLDVDGDAFPADAARNYAIPADNPFVGTPGADEIWALGLRNPWRPSFDRATGDLYIADVGQNAWEEINLGQAGANYGWGRFEGPLLYNPLVALGPGTLTFPAYVYGDGVNDGAAGLSITGGYVYRGPSEGLQGRYFYGDFIQSKVWTLEYDGANWISVERTGQIVPNAGTVNSISSFGEDGAGNLYIVDFGGEVFRLTPGANTADQADALLGNGGNDRLFGGSGNDLLAGGAGNDVLNGGADTDTADYTSATGNVVAEIWKGTAAADGQGGADTLVGIENATGGAFNDLLVGNQGANVLNGAAGNDVLLGGGGVDTLVGGAGNDLLAGGAGNDVLNGGADTDTADYTSATGNVVAEIWKGTAAADGQGGADTLAGIENATGGAFNDLLVGNEGANVLNGAAGNDVLLGGGGVDTLVGGAGNDLLAGGAGNDTLNGGADTDTADYTSATGNVVAEIWKGTAAADGQGGADTLVGIENATGGAFNDLLVGNEGANALNGAAGNDVLLGGGGVDTLLGGAGNDTLTGGAGNDVLNGGADTDTADYTSATGNVVAEIWKGTAAADGQGGADTLVGIENATGGAFNDLLVGNEGANVLNGAAGNDVLLGGGGVDTLLGGAGNDTLSGGNGNDTLTGGANQDLFLFANAPGAGNIDTITDFNVVDDTIQLENAIFTSLATPGVLAADSFISGAGLSGGLDANDFLVYNTTNGFLYYDADGSGAAASQQVATLLGAPAITHSDIFVV